jgi:Asp-tRNA(Asn)/Glu-tRNA(Gln) amidotransferase A subunit family amidase
MTDDDLCYLTAKEALKLFRARKVSPVDVLKAQIARSEAINPAINCFTDRYFDEALDLAKAAEAVYASRSARPRPLEGVTLAVKDAQRLKGKRTTHGSLIFIDNIDDHSDPMIERLSAAGAVIHARTTTPEFCLSGVCHSRAWGTTHNPFNIDFGPGGSSGGSAAALASGFTTLATGTDIGGSIRIPSSACGTVGFKPPHGRNPDGAPNCFDRYNHCGPMTRSVADAALMQSITAGPHALDHDSLRETIELPERAGSLRGLKVAYSTDFDYVNVDPEVRRNTLKAIDLFRSQGAQVSEVSLGWTSDVEVNVLHWYNTMDFGRQTVWWRKTHGHLMTDYALKTAEAIEKSTGIDDVHKPWAQAHRMYQTLGPVLEANDVFICPTLNLPAVHADHDPWDPDFHINGIRADGEYGWVMTHQFNMLQNCPVMAVPSGFASSDVPTGIQIVGRTFDDATVFKAALAYEKAVGGWFTDEMSRPKV